MGERLALEIGKHTVRLLQLTEAGGIKQGAEKYIEKSREEGGSIHKVKEWVESKIGEWGIKRVSLSIVLVDEVGFAESKTIRVPKAGKREIKAIKRELEIQGYGEGYECKYQKTREGEKDVEYLVTLVKKEYLAGLRVLNGFRVTIKGVMLMSVLLGGVIPEGEDSVVVYGSNGGVVLIQYREGVLQGVQRIEGGSIPEMFELPRELDFSEKQERVTEILRESIDNIIYKYRGIETEKGKVPIYVIGDWSYFDEILMWMSEEIDVEVQTVGVILEQGEVQMRSTYTLCGCVLLQRGDNQIEKYTVVRVHIDLGVWNSVLGGLLTGVILTSVIVGGIHKGKITEIDTKMTQIMGETQIIRQSMEVDSELIRQNKEMEEMVIQLEGEKVWLSDILYIVAEKVPGDVVITEIRAEGGIAGITGEAKTYTSVGYFAKGLEEKGEVRLDSVDKEENIVKFTLTVEHVRKDEKKEESKE